MIKQNPCPVPITKITVSAETMAAAERLVKIIEANEAREAEKRRLTPEIRFQSIGGQDSTLIEASVSIDVDPSLERLELTGYGATKCEARRNLELKLSELAAICNNVIESAS